LVAVSFGILINEAHDNVVRANHCYTNKNTKK
jgi:hypothetical protein